MLSQEDQIGYQQRLNQFERDHTQYHINRKYTFIKELINDGDLTRTHGGSRWASPTFVVPKLNNRIRIVSEFREVNMLIKRKPYHMPRMHEVI